MCSGCLCCIVLTVKVFRLRFISVQFYSVFFGVIHRILMPSTYIYIYHSSKYRPGLVWLGQARPDHIDRLKVEEKQFDLMSLLSDYLKYNLCRWLRLFRLREVQQNPNVFVVLCFCYFYL